MPTLLARTVTGIAQDAAGNPFVSKPIYASPLAVFGADGVVISTQAITALTDEEGAFSMDLYTLDIEDAFIRYSILMPGGEAVTVDVAYGSATTLDALINQNPMTEVPLATVMAALQNLVNTHAAAKASVDELGHIMIDGVTLEIDEDGVVSVVGAPPTGGAGGVLSGSFPNPGFAVDMATQGELDAAVTTLGNAIALKEAAANKDVSGGYVGKTLEKINFWNAARTFKSFLVNAATAVRTYTFPDRDGTIADDTDITAAKARANHTGTQTADTITDGTTNKVLSATNKTKLDNISITQAVDLDDIESRVNNLDAAVVLKGSWDASAGTFPGGGTAQAGASYIVSVAGIVGGVQFNIDDRAIAITDNASTTVYAANWFKADYTDQVLSVNGQTGAVTLSTTHIAEGTNEYFTAARVLSVVLTGISFVTSQTIAATDTVLQALGYLQAQITALTTTVGDKADASALADYAPLDSPNLTGTPTKDGEDVLYNNRTGSASLDSADGAAFRLIDSIRLSYGNMGIKGENSVTAIGDVDDVGNGTKAVANDDTQTFDITAVNGVTVNGSPIGGGGETVDNTQESSVTLTAAQAGTIFTSEAANVYFTLPDDAADGAKFSFVVRSGFEIQVIAPSGQTIVVGDKVGGNGGYVFSNANGSWISLIFLTDAWFASSVTGHWLQSL